MDACKVVVVPLEGQEKFTRLLSGAPQTQGLRSGLVHLQPDQEIGAHNTEGKEEALVIISGRAQILWAQGESVFVDAPALVYIPAHTIHNVKNCAHMPLRYVYLVAPIPV